MLNTNKLRERATKNGIHHLKSESQKSSVITVSNNALNGPSLRSPRAYEKILESDSSARIPQFDTWGSTQSKGDSAQTRSRKSDRRSIRRRPIETFGVRYPLYLSEQNDTWRYVLGTHGVRPLFAVGLNPHKATQTDPDRTVAKVERLALASGHDSFVMLNLYPVRSRSVAALPCAADTVALFRNQDAILDILKAHSPPHIWLAWGADMEKREYLRAMALHLIESAQTLNPVWYSLGPLTKRGHPRHPSRASNSWNLQIFDAESYVARLPSNKDL